MNPSQGRSNDAAPRAIRLRLASARDVLGDAIGNYQTNGDTNQAAAIALYAILSIIPLFVLTLLMIGDLFGGDPEIQKKLVEGIRQFIPSFSGELLIPFSRIEGKKELLGWAGIISLVWFSSLIFGAIETALNIIFRSKIYRNYFTSKLLAISMIPLGWAVGVVSVGITYMAAVLARQPLLVPGGVFFLPEAYGVAIRYLLPYLVTVVFFTLAYKAIPTQKVSLASALIGSAICSALMEIAKQFFTWYVAGYARYHAIFGPLEAVVILVLWAFYVALIFLFCAELISSYQRRDAILLEKALLKAGGGSLHMDERLFRKFGRLYGRDEVIFREGDQDRRIFFILAGRIRLEKSVGSARRTITEMGPGEYFGEMAALTDTARSATARTVEESHIAVIGAEMMRAILRENDKVSLFMLREFSSRIRRADEALEALTRSWIRLTAVVYLVRHWPLPEGRTPAEELAGITGREADDIRLVLEELGRQGVLTFEKGMVTRFDRDGALRLVEKNPAG